RGHVDRVRDRVGNGVLVRRRNLYGRVIGSRRTEGRQRGSAVAVLTRIGLRGAVAGRKVHRRAAIGTAYADYTLGRVIDAGAFEVEAVSAVRKSIVVLAGKEAFGLTLPRKTLSAVCNPVSAL